MVIVGGEFGLEPGERDAFLAGRVDMMRRSRSEPGCLEYTFSADPLDPGRVVLFERWESSQALDAHLAGLRAAPQEDGGGPAPKRASIVIYDVSGERPLGR